MPEITGATITFTDYSAPGTPRLLNVPDAWGDASVQDIWDTLATEHARLDNLIYKAMIDFPRSTGKQELSAAKSNGITLTTKNTRVKFADQPGPGWVIKRVIDGNFIAVDHLEAGMEALESSDFTNWKNEADVSAAILQSGSSGLTPDESAQLYEIYGRFGLDQANPLSISAKQIAFNSVTLVINNDGTTTTVTRQ